MIKLKLSNHGSRIIATTCALKQVETPAKGRLKKRPMTWIGHSDSTNSDSIINRIL